MIKIITSNTFRVYSYFDENSFKFIKEIKTDLLKDNYSKISLSKIILLAVMELKEHNSAAEIKQKLITKELI